MVTDTQQLKERIIQIIQRKGPSLPVHVSTEINQSMLFTSAFLAELLSEKRIKTSNMKVGNSPLYLIQGQEPQLEKYSNYLKSKEKEAFHLLKEKKFLEDSTQQPAIRVALREIKDFAIPFKQNDKIFWRYLTIPIEEFTQQKPEKNQIQKQEIPEEKPETKKELDIFEKEKPKQIKKAPPKKKTSTSQKKNEKFFNTIKEYLSSKNIEISDIIGFNKTDLTLKIIENQNDKILVAYNKKRITEKDITNAFKKSQEHNLPYKIFSLGEPTKKILSFIDAIKNLDELEKVD